MRAGDELLAVMRPGAGWTTRYVHHDAIGSVRALTDESGVVADTRGYEAFGTMNAEAGNDSLPYRFAGEPVERTSGLAYHRARWMDSRVGRFAGMDRLLGQPDDPRTLHAFAYASDAPTRYVDPSGNEFDLPTLSAVVAIVSIAATIGEPLTDTPLRHRAEKGCRVDVRATDIGGVAAAFPVYHLFMVCTDENGAQTEYRGGPQPGAPPGSFGQITKTKEPYRPGAIDWDPSAYSVTVLDGPEACKKQTCLASVLDMIQATRTPYAALGPNSNTVVSTLLNKCVTCLASVAHANLGSCPSAG